MSHDRQARFRLLVVLLLVFVNLALYGPLYRHPFLRFDDPEYVTANPEVWRGLSWHGVGWAFTTFRESNWHPLTWLSHMLDCELFGDRPGYHHLVNLLLHTANTVLLFLLLRSMTRATWRSGLVAALFAFHPLHVESVAWIAERKDLLSSFFWVLTMAFYARYAKGKTQNARGGAKDYVLALLCFILGLMSKPMLVTLPFVLLLLDFWPLRRFESNLSKPNLAIFARLVREKVPFFVLAAISCVITFQAQRAGGSVVGFETVSFELRLANAVVSYVRYLGKMIWPADLAVFYPYPPYIPILKISAACGFLLVVTLLAFYRARRAPFLLMGWLWYLGTLVPVIGLVQVGSQSRADRYTYMPLVGVFVMIAWGGAQLAAGNRLRAFLAGLLSGAAVIGCIASTWFQQKYWHNSVALFQRALEVSPRHNVLAHHNLGQSLLLEGNVEEGIKHFEEALRMQPRFDPAHFSLANALSLTGRHEEALTHYREAIRLKPDRAQIYSCMASSLVAQGKLDEAKAAFQKAVSLKPDYAEAHTKLGNLLLLLGAEAEALSHLHEAVRIYPDYDVGQYYLGGALARQKKFGEAVACFRAAIKANPDYVVALNDLAWILATQNDPAIRDVPEAIRLARRACERTQNRNPGCMDTLAVAYSEAGRFTEAIAATERAASLALAAGDEAQAAHLRRRLELYRAGHSYTQDRGGVKPNNPE